MAIGSPRTDKFSIGTSELRIALMSLANKQTPAHSIGALDDVTITIQNNSVTKNAGFPQRQVASAVTENLITVTGTPSEYSRRNIQILVGEVPEAAPTNVSSALASNTSAGATSIPLATGGGTGFAANDIIVIYPEGSPEQMTVARIASISTDTLTLSSDTPTLFAYTATVTKVFKSFPIGKTITKTNYFALQVIQSEFSTGRPLVWNFWKAAIASGLDLAMNATEFASTTMEINVLEPGASEYAEGGDLEHVAAFIAQYGSYMYTPGA